MRNGPVNRQDYLNRTEKRTFVKRSVPVGLLEIVTAKQSSIASQREKIPRISTLSGILSRCPVVNYLFTVLIVVISQQAV